MKKNICLILLISMAITLHAQLPIENTSAPSSPASSILGMQPKTVLTPKTYKTLELALFSNFLDSDNNFTIPNDFSLEFTPYWTIEHYLSLEEYLYPQNIFQQISRNSSLSLASTRNFLLGDSISSNAIAFGYRTSIYFGNKNDRDKISKFKQDLNSTQEMMSQVRHSVREIIRKSPNKSINLKDTLGKVVQTELLKCGRNPNDVNRLVKQILDEIDSIPDSDLVKFQAAFNIILDDKLSFDSAYNNLKRYIPARQGWTIDLAYANFLNFPDNNADYSIVPRHSIWISPTYRLNGRANFLKLLGVFRYQWYNTSYYKKYFPLVSSFNNNTDIGLGVNAEFNSFTFEFELMNRSSSTILSQSTDSTGITTIRKQSSSDLQYLLTFTYHLTDKYTLTYTVGKQFAPVNLPKSNLISMLSLNVGLGAPSVPISKK